MKKLRGNKKRLKKIENWKNNCLKIDFEDFQKLDMDYARFRIFPWNPVAMILNNYPNPKGKIRKKIIESFLDIYESWDKELKKTGEPYYLKIWIFQPDIHNSQIVCAKNEKIDYYENVFLKPKVEKNIYETDLLNINSNMSKYNWCNKIQKYFIYQSDYERENYPSEKEYIEGQNYLKKELLRLNECVEEEIDGIIEKKYLISGSNVWVGGK